MTNEERLGLMCHHRIPSTKLVTYEHQLPTTLLRLQEYVEELLDVYGDAPFEFREYDGDTIYIDDERHLTVGEIDFEIARRQKLEQGSV